MPQLASAIEQNAFLRSLIMGPPRVGKSTSIISTTPGPAYVILCDSSPVALTGAKRLLTQRKTPMFEWDMCKGYAQMLKCYQFAKEGVKEGKYKTVVIDTLSSFAGVLEEECLAATDGGSGPDGRRAYPDYERRLRHLMESFFSIPAHFIAISHYLQIGGEVDEKKATKKSGDGIVPLLAGKARATIPMMFPEIIFMDLHNNERCFVTNPQGAWGPGSWHLSISEKLPADIGALLNAIDAQNKADSAASNGARQVNQVTRVVAKRPLVSNSKQ